MVICLWIKDQSVLAVFAAMLVSSASFVNLFLFGSPLNSLCVLFSCFDDHLFANQRPISAHHLCCHAGQLSSVTVLSFFCTGAEQSSRASIPAGQRHTRRLGQRRWGSRQWQQRGNGRAGSVASRRQRSAWRWKRNLHGVGHSQASAEQVQQVQQRKMMTELQVNSKITCFGFLSSFGTPFLFFSSFFFFVGWGGGGVGAWGDVCTFWFPFLADYSSCCYWGDWGGGGGMCAHSESHSWQTTAAAIVIGVLFFEVGKVGGGGGLCAHSESCSW